MKNYIKREPIYSSSILLKFLNSFIFTQLKIKIEKMIYASFFFWKKHLNVMPLFFFFESLLKIRPLLGFYIYVIKKRGIKKIRITPYFMSFENRWKKAIYWISRSIKIQRGLYSLPLLIIKELYDITFNENASCLFQKKKHYKTLMMYKTSKNYIW